MEIKIEAVVRPDGNTAAHKHSDHCNGSFCFSYERSITLAKSVVVGSLLYSHGWEGLLDDSLLIKVARALCAREWVGTGMCNCSISSYIVSMSPSQGMECLDPVAVTRDHNLGGFNDRILFSGF